MSHLPPAQDHPAAHSMDSTWFAVDDDGQVAVFDTGEGGALPSIPGFPACGEAAMDNVLEVGELATAVLEVRAAAEPVLADLLPDIDDALRARLADTWWDFDDEEGARLLAALGVHCYVVDDGWALPYVHRTPVGRPIDIEKLPARLRLRLDRARLPVRFSAGRPVAPGEHVAITAWGEWWVDTEWRVHRVDGQPLTPEVQRTASDLADEARSHPFEVLPELSTGELQAAIQQWLHRAREVNTPRETTRKRGVLDWFRSLMGH